jgi:hypothetical protein
MTSHFSIEYSTHSSGVVISGHEHNGAKLVPVAPRRENLSFTFCASFGPVDLHDIFDTKPTQLSNLPCRFILVRELSSDELEVLPSWRIAKDRDSLRDIALHEVRRLERPRAARILRYNNDISVANRFVDHERPSCGSQ